MNKQSAIAKKSGKAAARKGIEGTGLIFDLPSCGGCRTCELACSFHHTQEFIPSVSSLKVLDKEEGPGYRVWISAEDDGRSIACDGCKGLDVPLCLEYCKEMDDLGKILLDFEARKVKKRNRKGETSS